mgnify:CR=1 FL=1
MNQSIVLPSRLIANARLLEKATHILNSLAGMPRAERVEVKEFTEGDKIEIPFWEELQDHVTDYGMAIENSLSRSKVAVEYLRQSRTNLHQLLKVIKSYIETYYGTNLVALASTGYDLSKIPTPKGTPPAPDKLLITATTAGEVLLTTTAYAKGKAYQFEYCLEDDTTWKTVVHTRNKLTLRGLNSRQVYKFRVAYVGSTPERNYSNIVSSSVL